MVALEVAVCLGLVVNSFGGTIPECLLFHFSKIESYSGHGSGNFYDW